MLDALITGVIAAIAAMWMQAEGISPHSLEFWVSLGFIILCVWAIRSMRDYKPPTEGK